MGEFITDGQPWENPDQAANEDYAQTPASFGSFLGASAASGPVGLLTRQSQQGAAEVATQLRAQTPEGERMRQLLNAAPIGADNSQAAPQPSAPPVPMLSPEEVKKQYGVDVSQPTSQTVAQVLGKQKADEIERDSTIARFQDAHSWPTNFAAGSVGFMLDPLNAASAFVPGVGEETMAAGLGRIGLGEGALRTGLARVGAGATGGLLGQAPLTAAHLAIDPDYGVRDAFRDMMFGAAAGALFHAGFGYAGDAWNARFGRPAQAPRGPAAPEMGDDIANADANTKSQAMQGSVSQLLDGRQIDVAPVFDAAAAAKARDEFGAWYAQQARLTAEADQILQENARGDLTAGQLTDKLQPITEQLEDLRRQRDSFQSDLEGAQGRLANVSDTETPQRIAAIDQELSQPGTAASRREDLTAERQMLTEGTKITPQSEALEQARTEAEIEGLQKGFQRVEGQIAALEKKSGPLQEKIATTTNKTNASLQVRSDRLASKERVVQAMAERSVRRYAGQLGVQLADGESRALASRVVAGGKAEIEKVLSELQARKTVEPLPVEAHGNDAALIQEANQRFGDTAQQIVADTAKAQQDIYRNGYAQGFPQAEFNEINEDIYGSANKAGTQEGGSESPAGGEPNPAQGAEVQPGEANAKESAEEQAEVAANDRTFAEALAKGEESAPPEAATTEGQATPEAPKLSPEMQALQDRIAALGALSAEERAEIGQALLAYTDADAAKEAYEQAASCLIEAGI